jgi:uncharacterized RmlC-like cupin family protein
MLPYTKIMTTPKLKFFQKIPPTRPHVHQNARTTLLSCAGARTPPKRQCQQPSSRRPQARI